MGAHPASQVVMVLPAGREARGGDEGRPASGRSVRGRPALPARSGRPRPRDPRLLRGRSGGRPDGAGGPRGRDARDAARAGAGSHALYEHAIDQLARLRAAAERRPADCIAFTRSFEYELYRWELDHFREWLLEAWKGAALSAPEREVVEREFDRIARALEAEPRGFTHRDYQSRNLMVLPSGEQAVIDFQDALLGPRQYDLVALLRDSYVELLPSSWTRC